MRKALALVPVAIVLAGCLGQGNPSPDSFALQIDEANDRWSVIRAESGLDWSKTSIKIEACKQAMDSGAVGRMGTSRPFHNEPAAGTGAFLNAAYRTGKACGAGVPQAVAAQSTPVMVGDYLEFCSSPASADMSAIHIVWIDTPKNATLAEATFADWADC